MSKQEENFGNKDSKKLQKLPDNFDKKCFWVRQTVTRKLEGQNVTVGAKGIAEVQCYTPEEFEDTFVENNGVISHRSLGFQVTVLHEPTKGADVPSELDLKKQEIEEAKEKELNELRQKLADSEAREQQSQKDLKAAQDTAKAAQKKAEDDAKKAAQDAAKANAQSPVVTPPQS
ncbi:hypothetical protein BWI97_15745 [Siphonobacter sp. BAB-5405]|uniref:hypothetical protein n=1 Tax=Siphonobacter sp. BAB-5405 TaxID=1864825 RepID=UPI000C810177|nr:hypothetical protein [Siphonobacter sp. BAB-5405]PMD94849.1 hypothetical protein BWI97_15745 [Siphonobacter sp. BAB-5405]